MANGQASGQDSSAVHLGHHQSMNIYATSGGRITFNTARSSENLLEAFPDLVLISIFLEDARDAEVIEAAVRATAEQLGLDIVTDAPPVLGSWFKRILARGRAELTEEKFSAAIQSAVRALELEQVEKRQAQVNATNIDAIAGLIDKLANTPAAVVQIGSLILIKTSDRTVVRELTRFEQATLRDNPILLTSPEAAAAVFIPGHGVSTGLTVERASEAPQIAGK